MEETQSRQRKVVEMLEQIERRLKELDAEKKERRRPRSAERPAAAPFSLPVPARPRAELEIAPADWDRGEIAGRLRGD